MTLAEKYGIQKGAKVGTINLSENPYTFKGTFEELYGLVAGGRLKLLTQNGMVVGGSISGYDNIEQDNLAGKAFMEAYGCRPLMQYVNLAVELVEANIIPKVITESPLTISILNGLVTLDLYGNEIQRPQPKATQPNEEVDDEDEVYEVPGNVVDTDRNIKNYIRAMEGRCLARGCNPDITYNEDTGVYEVRGIKWGRKLTDAELDLVTYETE